MSQKLYPLKFQPIFKEKIWGGNKLHKHLGKYTDVDQKVGESWELSAVKDNASIVSIGELKGKSLPELIKDYGEQLMGNKVSAEYGSEFPLLVKFIDAADDLSIQVHPNDELAKERHNSLGKTEMWYVMQADEKAKLITGFNRAVTKEEYVKYFNEGKLTSILNEEKVQDHDVFYIPAGRVHTIGKGLLIAEIQQTSDVTYRIYDFDRVDKNGTKRELHTEEALDSIDFKYYPDLKTNYISKSNEPIELVQSKYFTTQKFDLTNEITRDYRFIDSFVIYTVVEGCGEIQAGDHTLTCEKGEVILIPAVFDQIKITPTQRIQLLETYM